MESLPFGLDTKEYWFALTVSCVGALVGFYFAFHHWRRLRLIEDTATGKVRSLRLITDGATYSRRPFGVALRSVE